MPGPGYYEAMDAGLQEVYGPSETLRTFRLPTLFMIWSRIPNDWLVWVAFVVAAAGTGFLTMRLTRFLLVGPVVTLILLATGRIWESGEWIEQYTTVELWAAGLVVAVAVLWQQRAYRRFEDDGLRSTHPAPRRPAAVEFRHPPGLASPTLARSRASNAALVRPPA